ARSSRGRERHHEDGTRAGSVLGEVEAAAQLLSTTQRVREPEAGSLAWILGGEEGVEDPLAVGPGHARSIVLDAQLDGVDASADRGGPRAIARAALEDARGQAHAYGASVGPHRVAGVEHQVEQELCDGGPVGERGGDFAFDDDAEADPRIAPLCAHELENLLGHLTEVDRPGLAARRPREAEEVAQDRAHPLDLRARLREV